MSCYDPRVKIWKYEKVDFIVPERLIEARLYRNMTREEASEKLEVTNRQLGLYENGHEEIPLEFLFWLQKVYSFPKEFLKQ